MVRWSINLFRVRGIQLAVHLSFPLFLAYWAWDGYRTAGWEGALWSSLFLLSYFACVVLHELGHSFTGMRYGLRVRRILLMPIGGVAEFDSIPRQPRQELAITFAGPLVNYTLAGILYLLNVIFIRGGPDGPGNFGDFIWQLMLWNLAMGTFNLLPAFPMDGGRILRACLAFRLPYARATFWAASIGKGVGAVGIAGALYEHSFLLAALFLYILGMGELEYRAVLIREKREEEWAEAARRLAAARRQTPPAPPLLDSN